MTPLIVHRRNFINELPNPWPPNSSSTKFHQWTRPPLKFIDKLLVFPASGDVRASGTGRVGEEGRAMRPMKSVRSRRTLASKNQRRSPVPHCLWLEFCWGLSETGTGIGGGPAEVYPQATNMTASCGLLRYGCAAESATVVEWITSRPDCQTSSSSIHQWSPHQKFINSSIHQWPPS